MNDDFHAHLVETDLKTQASNMHELSMEKVKKEFPYIFMEERYRTSSVSEFTSMRSVKDMDSTTCWKRLCCFAYVKKVANMSKDYKKDEKSSSKIPKSILCYHLSMILDRNPEADLRLSCLLQMSMVPMVFLEIFCPIFQIS